MNWFGFVLFFLCWWFFAYLICLAVAFRLCYFALYLGDVGLGVVLLCFYEFALRVGWCLCDFFCDLVCLGFVCLVGFTDFGGFLWILVVGFWLPVIWLLVT